MQSRWCYAVLVLAAIGGSSSSPAPPPQGQPHLILIVADDLGWNDVSWHNPQVLTPHLENLARGGVILEQSYVQPICTPTRSALLTGRYPFTLGRQHGVLWPKEPTGLTLKATLLPESLKEVGYSTHAVGKWHLGFCSWRYTPTRRGFDTFYGYYTGAEDYFHHFRPQVGRKEMPNYITSQSHKKKDGARFGYDFRNNTTPDLSVDGTYSTYALASYVEDLLASRSPADPMFLYLPFQSVHSPLQVPENYTRPYRYIKHKQRRTKLGMVTAMDEAVGRVVSALKSSGHYNNSVIVFTTDNGGPTVSAGNNWPLRGNKSTLWEGGTRGAAFVHSPLLQNPGTVSHKLVHVTDWYETFMGLAGGKASEDTDGFDQWAALDGRSRSPRTHMIYNIDNTTEFSGGIRFGDYKLLVGNPGPGEWTPPPEGIQDTLTDVPDDIANNSTPSSALFHPTPNHTVDYPDVQDQVSMNITYLAASNASRLDASVDADVNGILVTTGNVTTSSWNAQLDNHEEYEVKEEEEDGERVRMEEKEEKEEEEEEEEEEKEEEGEGVEEEEKEGVDEEEKIKEKEETEEGKGEEEKQGAEEEEDKEEKDLQEDKSVEDGVNTTEKGEEKYESVGDYLHAREFVDSLLNTKEIRLFNLKHDPDERINLAASKPEVVKILLALLLREMKTRYVDADLLPNDPRANPKYWHNFWSPGWCKAK
ncbi:arylsulfatase B-like [Penaeus japonicus]|uniref:arylsulfatase B-like n=1 Tax=Penaeus japonicus TaxID=27405 RepID=UPI001C71060B|nr:arylsulfatase B-like [Penaeus japonicus]XP_042860609.1 arylsulfatase B-like [Penaeus japonicus]